MPTSTSEAAAGLDADPLLEAATYSILEEDEDRGVWRIDAFPTTDDEVEGLKAVLAGHPVTVLVEKLADADWLAMAETGQFEALAEGLMAAHYDPRYARHRSRMPAPAAGITAATLEPGDLPALAAKVAQAEGDALYWPIYNLDIKNPHAPETALGDPNVLLAQLQQAGNPRFEHASSTGQANYTSTSRCRNCKSPRA